MASVFALLEAFNRKELLHLDFFLVQQPLFSIFIGYFSIGIIRSLLSV